jgi:hypothetical protein
MTVPETIEPSDSRASALRTAQRLVSQRLDVPGRDADSADDARALLDTVDGLRAAAGDAGR